MADQSPIFRLPTELVQHIASFLLDEDICAFSRTCVSFAAQVLPADSSVWRIKFKDQYDSVQHHTSAQLKVEYQTRALVLSRDISFRHGETEQGYLWLEVLQTLILEALLLCTTRSTAFFQPVSKNLERIAEVIQHSDFLSRPITGYGDQTVSEPSRLFCTVQLCLTHLSFNMDYSRSCSRDDYNIEYVYSYASLIYMPLVDQGEVDLKALLHIRNFWQRHFTSPLEDTFLNSYQSMTERPDTWISPFEQGDIFKTFWLGYYSCIHPYPVTADDLKSVQTCADFGEHSAETCANSLSLAIDNNPENSPDFFNAILPMSVSCPKRVFFRGTQKYFSTTDNFSTYPVRGFLEPIPDPQGGIPGWTRIFFVTYDPYEDEDDDQTGHPSFPDEDWSPVDFDDWTYEFEGIILPGGRIMLGQWLDARVGEYLDCSRGPFIYWDA